MYCRRTTCVMNIRTKIEKSLLWFLYFYVQIRIKKTLINAGAPIEKFNENQSYNMIEKFRKDTDFLTEYFYNKPEKISVSTTAVMSKTDPFTKNYKKAEKLWGRMADNFDKVHFIDTDSHYFQTDNSETLAEIIAETICK